MNLIRHMAFENPPHKISFSQDGSRLWVWAVTKRESTNLAYELIEILLADFSETRSIVDLDAMLFDVAFLDSERIVAVGIFRPRKHMLCVYDLKKQRTLYQAYTEDVRALCVDYRNKRVFAGTLTGDYFENAVGIYNFMGHPQKRFKVQSMPFDMALSHTGEKLAIASVFFEVYDVSGQGKQIYRDNIEGDGDCTGTPCEACAVDITPDGRYAVGGFHGGRGMALVVDTQTGQKIRWLGPEGSEMNYYEVNALAISPDGKYVAISSPNFKSVPLYRVSDGELVHKFPVYPCGSLAFSPNGEILALSDVHSVSLWVFKP
jgi:WD40 repeat protein